MCSFFYILNHILLFLANHFTILQHYDIIQYVYLIMLLSVIINLQHNNDYVIYIINRIFSILLRCSVPVEMI